jgi:hypothetical protein
MRNYLPLWLEALLTETDRAIVEHPKAVFLMEDRDRNRLPDYQQLIESPAGSMWIDSQRKAIIGYGPAVDRPVKGRCGP